MLSSPSGNGRDWQPVTVSGSGDWNQCRILNGLALLVGDGGRMYATTDFVGFVAINTSTTTDLYDIAYDSVSDRYVVCGANGLVRWCSRADLLVPTPAWTQVVTGTTSTLTRAAWTGSIWTFGGDTDLVVSADLTNANTQLVVDTCRGMLTTPIAGGTLYILYGDAGLILTSVDKLTWTKRVSNTTSALRCGVVNAGYAMLAGDNGVLVRADITNPGTWTVISVGTSATINAIAYSSGRSEVGLCGAGGIAYRSTNNGVTWLAMATGSGQDMYGIWGNGTSWECVGAAGAWRTTSNGTSWTARVSQTSAAIRCGAGNIAYGDSGYIGYLDAYVHNQGERFGVTGVNFVAVAGNTLLTSTGVTYQVAFGPHPVSGTNAVLRIGVSGSAPGATSLTLDAANTTMYAVGGSTAHAATAATSYMDFAPWIVAYAGVRDLQYISGSLWIVGDNGLVAKSTSGYIWLTQALRGDTTTRRNVAYYIATNGLAQIQGIVGYAAGNPTIMCGAAGAIYSGAGPALPALALTRTSIQDSVISSALTSSVPASVLRSVLRVLDNAGSISDTVITDGLAHAYGSILRCEISLVAPLSIHGDILISESVLDKTRSYDLSDVLFAEIDGSVLQIDTSSLEYRGLLAYSEDTALSIRLNACRNSTGFASALSNGYAKVYLANCNNVPNASAYSVDGSVLDAAVRIGSDTEISGSLADWYGLPAGTTTDTHKLTLLAPLTLGPSAFGPTCLRWAGTGTAIKLLQNVGGRINLEIVYPAGYTPNPRAAVRVGLVKPQLSLMSEVSGSGITWLNMCNESLTLGRQAPVQISKTAGKLTMYANVYGGYADIYKLNKAFGSNRRVVDQWSDNSDTMPVDATAYTTPWARSAVVVIWATADLVLPSGTTIKVVLEPVLPSTRADLLRWYNDVDRTLDPYQATERQQLAFEAAGAVAGLDLAYRPVSGTSTSEDIKWLSLKYNTSGPALDTYTGDAVATTPYNGSSAVIPTNKASLWSGLAQALVPVKLDLAALPDSTWHTVNSGQEYKLGTQDDGSYTKLRGYVIANTVWTTVVDKRITLP